MRTSCIVPLNFQSHARPGYLLFLTAELSHCLYFYVTYVVYEVYFVLSS